jgi:hypothetical protein
MKTFSTPGTTTRINKAAGFNALLVTAFLIAATALPGLAQADTGSGRAEVKAALAEAQRTGSLPDYETGKMLHELFPGAYPKANKPTEAERTAVLPTLDIRPAAGPASKADKASESNTAIGVFDYDLITQRNAQALARKGEPAQGVHHNAGLR